MQPPVVVHSMRMKCPIGWPIAVPTQQIGSVGCALATQSAVIITGNVHGAHARALPFRDAAERSHGPGVKCADFGAAHLRGWVALGAPEKFPHQALIVASFPMTTPPSVLPAPAAPPAFLSRGGSAASVTAGRPPAPAMFGPPADPPVSPVLPPEPASSRASYGCVEYLSRRGIALR